LVGFEQTSGSPCEIKFEAFNIDVSYCLLRGSRINRLARAHAELANLLRQKGILESSELDDLAKRLADSPEHKQVNECIDKVRQLAQVRKIAQQYLDSPEE
jgi:hypothetical protein